jgi:hypothetical protein
LLLRFQLLKHVYKINKAPVENESLSWYFVSNLKPPGGRLPGDGGVQRRNCYCAAAWVVSAECTE